MKRVIERLVYAILIMIFLIGISPLKAQQAMTMKFNADETVIVPELSAIIKQAKDTLKVSMLIPGGKVKDYAAIDLKVGDLIMAINGKNVKSAPKFRLVYDALKVGDTVKLALVRDGESKNISFPKADPSKLPGQFMLRKVGPDDAKAASGSSSATGTKVVSGDSTGVSKENKSK